jgi:glycosyltransferase involved in cell wall biosynthesis
LDLRIAFISPSDPQDKDAQSGEIHRIFRRLQKFGEVIYLAPVAGKYYLHHRVMNRIGQTFFHKGYNFAFSVRNSKRNGRELTKRLAKDRFDVIFAPYGCRQIAFLETTIPIIYLSDTTFQNMIGYYPSFSNLLRFSQREGNVIEQRAISKARYVIYPSEWAANSAIRDYGAPPEKVHIIPPGASLERIPLPAAPKAHEGRTCNLLFVGRDWQRKGGELAVAALEKLAEYNFPAQLTIVGCQPPITLRENIRVIPYLNKNREEEARIIEQLYAEADFLILPTRAECGSIAAIEASAFGVPVIATDTGGLPSNIKEGINGFLLPLTATGDDFAKVVATLFRDEKRYRKLRDTSRQEYERRSDGEVWSREVARIIGRVVS